MVTVGCVSTLNAWSSTSLFSRSSSVATTSLRSGSLREAIPAAIVSTPNVTATAISAHSATLDFMQSADRGCLFRRRLLGDLEHVGGGKNDAEHAHAFRSAHHRREAGAARFDLPERQDSDDAAAGGERRCAHARYH